VIRARLIVNPAAGRGAGARAGEPAARAFERHGWSVDLVRTEQRGHAVELAHTAATDGLDRVIAVGGDGTAHEVANGLLAGPADPPALGVVPVGSGNDFAKLVGTYRHDVASAVGRVVGGRVRRFDVGRAHGEFFINSMGVGFGPHVVSVRNRMTGLRGALSYLVPIVRAFFSFDPPELVLETPAFTHRGPVMLIEVCNGTTAGGHYRFAPQADPADGRLDVCLVRRVGLGRFLLALPRVARGRHGSMRECTIVPTTTAIVRAAHGPLLMHLDGELREPTVDQCTVTVEAERLPVLVA
jgi:YegS/Rv2252/BmrU family lipid kinase